MTKQRPVVEVEVTTHAREQARDRYPGFKAARIVDEVRQAFCEGRYGTRPPKGTSAQCDERTLYAWTPDEIRCYAIRPTVASMLVVTTLSPRQAAAA